MGVGLLVALMVLATRQAAQLDLPRVGALAFMGFCLVPLAFATWFGDAAGLAITWNDEAARAGMTIGWHAAGTPVVLALLIAIFARSSAITRAARRGVTREPASPA